MVSVFLQEAKKYWKVFLIAVILMLIADSIGPISVTLPFGKVSMFPLIFAIILGCLFGPDILRIVDEEQCKFAGSMVMVVMAPYMVKMGIGAGHNLGQLIELGPALILQEFGNLGTIFLTLPIALLLGIKKEAIGACYSINRDVNLGLTTDVFGAEAAETKGTFAVYITGAVVGTVFASFMISIIASLNVFHPLALGMAAGVGSSSMMAAMTGTLSQFYPEYAEQMAVLAGASDMLTGADGLFMGVFIGIPLTKYLYRKLEPVISKLRHEKSEVLQEMGGEKDERQG